VREIIAGGRGRLVSRRVRVLQPIYSGSLESVAKYATINVVRNGESAIGRASSPVSICQPCRVDQWSTRRVRVNYPSAEKTIFVPWFYKSL